MAQANESARICQPTGSAIQSGDAAKAGRVGGFVQSWGQCADQLVGCSQAEAFYLPGRSETSITRGADAGAFVIPLRKRAMENRLTDLDVGS